MAKLTGTNPDQVPTNADLGTMAYQDKDQIKVGTIESTTESGAVLFKTGDDQYSSALVGKRPIGDNFANLEFDAGQTNGVIKIEADGSGHLSFYTANGSRMVLLSDGKLGIGTQSPAHKLDVAGELIADSYNETYSALSGTTPTVNCETGNAFSLTLSGNTTFTFSNPPASGTAYSFSIEIIQDASASGYTVTWPSSVDWPSGTAPTLTATASAKDVFVFTTRDGGTNWYGFTAGQALG